MTETQLGEAAFDATRVARLLRAADGSVRVALIGPAGEFASVPLTDRTREGLVRAVQVVAELRARLARPVAPAPPPPPAVAPARASYDDLVRRADAVRSAAAEELPTESFDGDPVSATVIAAVPSDHDLATLAPEEAERRLSRAEAMLAAARAGEDLWRLDPAAHRAPEGSFSAFVRSRPVPVPFAERFGTGAAEPVRPLAPLDAALAATRTFGLHARPASYGSVPEGEHEELPNLPSTSFNFGLVRYRRRLSADDVARFELVPVWDSPEAAAQALFTSQPRLLRSLQVDMEGVPTDDPREYRRALVRSIASAARVDRRDPRRRFYLLGQFSAEDVAPVVEDRLRGVQGAPQFAQGEKIRSAAAYQGHGLPSAPEKAAANMTNESNAAPKDIDITLADVWHGLVRYGLRVGSPDVGFTRIELIGPMAAWEAARRAVAVERSESTGPAKVSATAALARIDAQLNLARVDAAKAIARGMIDPLPRGDLRMKARQAILFAGTIEDVVSALKLAGFTPESIAAAGIVPHVEEKIVVAKTSPTANTPEYRKAIVETAEKKVASARRKLSDANATARRAEKTADEAEMLARKSYGMVLDGAQKRAAEARASAKIAREQANEADKALEKAQKALEGAEKRYREAVAASK